MEDYRIPQDKTLECTILGELVNDPTSIPQVRTMLSSDMFYYEECSKLYNVLIGMYDNHEDIDAMVVLNRVNREFFINNIIGVQTNYASFAGQVKTLRDVYLKRKAYFIAMDMLKLSQEPMSSEEILSLPMKMKDELEKNVAIPSTKSLGEVMNKLGEEWSKGKRERLATKIPTLDKLTFGGFGKGNLVVLAARPSVGKTAFMLQIARNMAKSGLSTLSLSLEMTNPDLAERLVFATNRLSQRDVSKGEINWEDFEKAIGDYGGCKMYFEDSVNTLDEVCNSITINHHQGKCDIAFIDYLGLMTPPNANAKLYQQISEMTKRLKKLAMSLGIPIVVLCQMNRNSENNSRAPILADLRDSGSIEQDADIVLMLERLKDEFGEENIIRMWVRKNRGGIGGDIYIDLKRDESYTNFYEYDNERTN